MARSAAVDPPDKPLTSSLSHLDDTTLRPFQSSSFSHVDHLNATLPLLSVSTPSQSTKQRNGTSLAEMASQTQNALSRWSVSTARLLDTLTSLTDDIIRTSSRLAYEVDVLRGDAVTLSEALDEGLVDDIRRFAPEDPSAIQKTQTEKVQPVEVGGRGREASEAGEDEKIPPRNASLPTIPPYIDQLRTLSTVKDRLDSVVKTFGQAMEWTLPPSEISITSSFISVSAPDPESDIQRLEEKGQATSKKLREEITTILAENTGFNGVQLARRRVEELRELAKVWKGTAEEKARNKFVEALAKIVMDKQRSLEKDGQGTGAS